jgi:hypothetical protein
MNTGDNIVDAVRKFLLRNKVKIIFGTPCFGGLLHNGFFQSMLELAGMFTRLAIPFEVITIGNESLIQRARNGIVAKFLADEQATHLMFIDADVNKQYLMLFGYFCQIQINIRCDLPLMSVKIIVKYSLFLLF